MIWGSTISNVYVAHFNKIIWTQKFGTLYDHLQKKTKSRSKLLNGRKLVKPRFTNLIRFWSSDDCLFKFLQRYFVHNFLTQSEWKLLNLSHKKFNKLHKSHLDNNIISFAIHVCNRVSRINGRWWESEIFFFGTGLILSFYLWVSRNSALAFVSLKNLSNVINF